MIRPRSHLQNMYREGQPLFSRFDWERLGYNEYVPFSDGKLYKQLRERLNNEVISAYPSVNDAYKAIGEMISRKQENIMLTTGVDGAIMNVFLAFCDPCDKVVLVTPNYGMYYVYSDLMNASVKEVKYNSDFELDYNDLLNAVDQKTKIVALASPSGFSGQVIPEDIMLQLIEKANGLGCIVLLDEVYADFYDGGVSRYIQYIDQYDNLVIARSFSKSYGLAGLRVGYLVANEVACKEIKRVRQNVEINSAAVEAVKIWCEAKDSLEKCLSAIIHSREQVTKELREMGYEVRESVTNFCFIKVGKENMQRYKQVMENEKIELKYMSGDSLYQDYIRVTIGKYDYMKHFLDVMRGLKTE